MQVDNKPWKVYRDGKLIVSVDSHKTANTIVKAYKRMFPDSVCKAMFDGKTVNHFRADGKGIDG